MKMTQFSKEYQNIKKIIIYAVYKNYITSRPSIYSSTFTTFSVIESLGTSLIGRGAGNGTY